jgi:L-2-hydroxyglutarate oxidase LhgO
MGGQARFGPDMQAVDEIDYAVDTASLAAFEAAIRRYWPGLPDGALQPGYAGIRAKVTRDPNSDFRIEGPKTHGIAGLVNFFGIDSPGLTASLWLGDLAVRLLKD